MRSRSGRPEMHGRLVRDLAVREPSEGRRLDATWQVRRGAGGPRSARPQALPRQPAAEPYAEGR